MKRPIDASHGLARVMSKRGLCSRAAAERLVRSGRVRVGDRVEHDPEARTPGDARIVIDAVEAVAAARRYLLLNKPRGLVTTRSDERGRDTVYTLLGDAGGEWLAPVGRLDKASEGALLFTNDSAWAAAITAPGSKLDKTYHVQIDRLVDADVLDAMRTGVDDAGEHLALKSVRELRRGEKHAWLEIVLDGGRNRQIRRVLAAFDLGVLRLVRVAIGTLALGELGKGKWRDLDEGEVVMLASSDRRRGSM